MGTGYQSLENSNLPESSEQEVAYEDKDVKRFKFPYYTFWLSENNKIDWREYT